MHVEDNQGEFADLVARRVVALLANRPAGAPEEKLLTIDAACQRLGDGRTRLYELVNAGELTLVKSGRRSLITSSSIDALIARRIDEASGIEPAARANGQVARSRRGAEARAS